MTDTPRRDTLRSLAESFATLIAEFLLPVETLDRLMSPDGMALGTECTLWYVPSLGKVVVWDMVCDPEMADAVRVPIARHTPVR